MKIIKWMSKLGPLLGPRSADKLTLDVSHLSASQLLTHGTSSPICQESHSLLLECSHLWSRTQQLFKELTETNQGQDAKTQPKCRGKQGREGREKCQPSPLGECDGHNSRDGTHNRMIKSTGSYQASAELMYPLAGCTH